MGFVRAFAQKSRLSTLLFLCAVFLISLIQTIGIRSFDFISRRFPVESSTILSIAPLAVCVASILYALMRWSQTERRTLFLGKLLLALCVTLCVYLILGVILGLLSLFGSDSDGYRLFIHILASVSGAVPAAFLICIIGKLVRSGELSIRMNVSLFLTTLALTFGLFAVQYLFALIPTSSFALTLQSLVTAIGLFLIFAYVITHQSHQSESGQLPDEQSNEVDPSEEGLVSHA